MNVTRDNNRIKFFSLNNPKCFSDFLQCMYHGIKAGYSEFTLDFQYIKNIYPNAVVPIVSAIEYYKENRIDINYINMNDYLNKINLTDPILADSCSQIKINRFDRIWKFVDFENVTTIVNNIIDEVSKKTVCGNGVVESIEWCLNEIMDNVLQHSLATKGYIMCQLHESSKHFSICVCDTGQGIFNSFKKTDFEARNPIDAITQSIKEGVTRNKNIGQGNGLWGLHSILYENSGRLNITSSGSSYYLNNKDIKTFGKLPFLSRRNGMCVIDFQLDFDKPISISKALGHSPISTRNESYLSDTDDIIEYKLEKETMGTGTRKSGERIRNDIINLYNSQQKAIKIDFKDISVVSSSFADEFLGKLVIHFGFLNFNQIFRLTNMNEIVSTIINRSVMQRISEGLNSNIKNNN